MMRLVTHEVTVVEENSSNTTNMAPNNSNHYLEETYKQYVASLSDAVNIVNQCSTRFLDLKVLKSSLYIIIP